MKLRINLKFCKSFKDIKDHFIPFTVCFNVQGRDYIKLKIWWIKLRVFELRVFLKHVKVHFPNLIEQTMY